MYLALKYSFASNLSNPDYGERAAGSGGSPQ